jgi:hypothetical protein
VSAGDLKLLGAYFDVGSGGLAIYARARVSLRRRWNCCCSERGFTPALKNSGDLEIGGAVLMDWPQKFISKTIAGWDTLNRLFSSGDAACPISLSSFSTNWRAGLFDDA